MNSHIRLRVWVHLVWATRERLPGVLPEIEEQVYAYIASICERNGCMLLAIGGMPDHVHVLVSLSDTVSIKDLVQQMKGGSSRIAAKIPGEDNFPGWQRGYSGFSLSADHKERVVNYIKNQKHHHQNKTLWSFAEPDDNNESRP